MSTTGTFQQCIDYVDISWHSAARGRQTREAWEKQAIFELNASISPKRWEIRPKLLLVANRKVHMCFRLAQRSMTLDDHELYKFEFSENFAGFRTVKRMKIDQ